MLRRVTRLVADYQKRQSELVARWEERTRASFLERIRCPRRPGTPEMAEKAKVPFDEIEWELIRADLVELKATAKASGDWEKWNQSQKSLSKMPTPRGIPTSRKTR
jgi:hypothetical protein